MRIRRAVRHLQHASPCTRCALCTQRCRTPWLHKNPSTYQENHDLLRSFLVRWIVRFGRSHQKREKMPFLCQLPSRPPFGWSLLLSASLPPPALLTLSPRAAAAHPLSSLCLAWLDAMCACPHLQLLVYRSASALLQRSRKTTREGDSRVLSQQQVVLLEVAALGLMRSAGTGRGAWQPVVCADAAVAAVLQLKPTSASCAADLVTIRDRCLSFCSKR